MRPLLLTALLALLAGCGGKPAAPPAEPAKGAAEATNSAESVAAPPLPADRDSFVSKLPLIPPQPQSPAEKVATFGWKDEPGPGDVPQQPVTGMLRGKPFICRFVSVAPDEEYGRPTLRLRFSDHPRGDLCSFSLDDDAVILEWSRPAGVGEFRKELAEPAPVDTVAWYTLKQDSGTLFTRHTGWACWLKIEQTLGSTEKGGVGSLVGRIALVFKDEEKSWLAGTFRADGCHY